MSVAYYMSNPSPSLKYVTFTARVGANLDVTANFCIQLMSSLQRRKRLLSQRLNRQEQMIICAGTERESVCARACVHVDMCVQVCRPVWGF
jgi:hypothetical protein